MRADEIVDGFRGGASDGYQNAEGVPYPRGEARCKCPTCGHQMPVAEMDLLRLVETVALTAKRQVVLDALIEAYPGPITVRQLAEVVYGRFTDPNLHSMRVLIYHLRKDIDPYGWLIPASKWGRGYRLVSKIKRK